MNEKVFEALQALAAKLGTTVDMLWGALRVQARVELISDLLLLAMIVFSVLKWLQVYSKLSAKYGVHRSESGYKVDSSWDEHVGEALLLGTWGLTTAGFLIYWVCIIPTVFAEAFNPSYWALRKLLYLVAGGC